MVSIGLLLALIACLSWGFGDFFIQRSVRAVGNITALGAIGAFGFVVLTPWVWSKIPVALNDPASRYYLIIAFIVTLVVALLEFQSFKIGKLSIIEPIMSLELPMTVGIGLVFLQERITDLQLMLITGVFLGVALAAIRLRVHHWWSSWRRPRLIEAGVWLGVVSAAVMALANVYTGLASQRAGPLVAIWFIHTSLAFFCLIVILVRRQMRTEVMRVKKSWRAVLGESFFDNLAWISYSGAVTFLPISLTIGITESYIALAALLGIIVNREKLQRHQYVGMGLALIAAIVLGIVSEK